MTNQEVFEGANITPVPIAQAVTLPPTTTLQENITLKGQRSVNLIWEITQAFIAVVMTLGVVIVTVYSVLSPFEITQEFPPVLSNAFFLIVGFYFSRTNHAAIGGIGPKANVTEYYTGR